MHILLIAPEMIDTHTRRFIEMLLGAGYMVTCVGKENPKLEGDKRYAFIQYPGFYVSKRIFPQRLRRTLRDWGIADTSQTNLLSSETRYCPCDLY